MTEDEMVKHHQLNGYQFEQTLEVSKEQRSTECCNPWLRRVDTTQQLNNEQHTHTHLEYVFYI